jgi:hypothetical protein
MLTETAAPENLSKKIPFALAEELLRKNGEMRFVAQGGSMLPAILPRDELVVHRAVIGDICPGDMVLFKQEGRWFAHRVRQIVQESSQACLITRGDALRSDDSLVFPEEFLGRIPFLVRGGEQCIISSGRSALEFLLRAAIRHVPFFAGIFLRYCRFRAWLALLLQPLHRRSAEKLSEPA